MCVCVCDSDHRHSSHHTRHPLSKHADSRRKRTGKKKRSKEQHLSDDFSVQVGEGEGEGEEEEEKHTDKPENGSQDGVQVHTTCKVHACVGVCHSHESN